MNTSNSARVRRIGSLLAVALVGTCLVAASGGPAGAAADDCIEVVGEIDMGELFPNSLLADGTTLYIQASEDVVRFDTTTGTETARESLGHFIGGMALADGKLYVTGVGPDVLEVLDADTLAPITTIAGFATPTRPSVVDGLVYVPQQSDSNVLVVDPATDTIVDTIPSLNANGSHTFDGLVYVMGLGTSGIDVIDPAVGAVVDNIAVGDIPIGMAVIGSNAWVTNAADNTVSQVDLNTNTTVGAAFPVAGNPRSLVVLDGALYYSANAGDVVQAIDPADNSLGFSLAFPTNSELSGMVVIGERIYVSGFNEVHVLALCESPATTTTTTTAAPFSPVAVPVTAAQPRFTG